MGALESFCHFKMIHLCGSVGKMMVSLNCDFLFGMTACCSGSRVKHLHVGILMLKKICIVQFISCKHQQWYGMPKMKRNKKTTHKIKWHESLCVPTYLINLYLCKWEPSLYLQLCFFKPVVLLACMTEHILIKLATDFQLKSAFEKVINVKKANPQTVLEALQKTIQKKFKSVVILKIRQI